MKIIMDQEKKYYDEVLKYLREHNNKFAGDVPHGERFFYIVENNELIAGAKITYSWSWASFNLLHYNNIDELKMLMKSIQSFFKGKVTGLKSHTTVKQRFLDMEAVGFKFEAKLKGTKLVKDTLYSINTHFEDIDVDNSSVVESEEGIEEYTNSLKEKVELYKSDNNLNSKEQFTSYIALDGDKFAGGVVGYTEHDSMYVDLLVVKEDYKGQGVGTLLMNELENNAMNDGVIVFNLGTAEFQAKPFYEKRGYDLIMTLKDYPIGYECYTMQKKKTL